jgi:4,5-DOPA dioxygenase extradiol
VNWQDENASYDWALEVRDKVNTAILDGNHQSIIDFQHQGAAFQQAIPTAEHYIPLLYALGLQTKADKVSLFNDKIVMGSLSMTGVMIG